MGDADGADEAAPSGKNSKRRKAKEERPAEDEAPEAGEGVELEVEAPAAVATPRVGKADKRKQQMRSRAHKIQKDAAGSE